MKVVGLCGGSGSGKSITCKVFKEYGIDYVSADDIYHEMISGKSECLDDIVRHFGEDVLSDGKLDRKKMRGIVFNSDEKRALLNSITHPHVLKRIREIIEEYRQSGAKGILIDMPLLFESGFYEECDITICIYADIDKRIDRIMARDGITKAEAEARIYSQVAAEYLASTCDYVIENNSNVFEMRINSLAVKKRIFDYD